MDARRATAALMVVICKVKDCPYWEDIKAENASKGFCKNPLLSVNKNGVCDFLVMINKYAQNSVKMPEGYELDLNLQDAEIVGDVIYLGGGNKDDEK